MPRLKKEKKENRLKVLPPCRVSQSEQLFIYAKAKKSGLNFSEYQRRALVHALVVQSKAKGDIELILELRRQGRNLNQYQKKLNSLNIDSPIEVKRVLSKIENILERLL